MASVKKLSDIDVSLLILNGGHKICEKISPGKVRRLYFITPIMKCPTGINENYIELEGVDTFYRGLSTLEDWIQIHSADYHPMDRDRIRIYLDYNTKIYDRDGELMVDRDCLNGTFRCSLIVDASEITERGYLKLTIFQMKVYSFSLLPEGCRIMNDRETFLVGIADTETGPREKEIMDDGPAEGYDPNLNELL